MLGFLSTILFVRTVLYLFDKKSATQLGFSLVLKFLARLIAVAIVGIVLSLFQDKLDYNAKDWTGLVLSLIIFSVMTLSMFQASAILKKANPLIYNDLQEFQIFQSIARANNFASGIFAIGLMINAIFLFFLILGVMAYMILFLVTLGAIWWDKKVKIDDFIYIPNQFFKLEENYFEFVGVEPILMLIIAIGVLFLMPTFLAWWIIARKNVLLKS